MIPRRRRTRILVLEGGDLARSCATQIRDLYPVTVLDTPEECLVMVKNKETARNSTYYLGEVLVTEARVRLGEATGIGLIQGHEPDFALDLAVIDAAYQAGLPETQAWDEILLLAEQEVQEKRFQEDLRILASRVSFESMDQEGAP